MEKEKMFYMKRDSWVDQDGNEIITGQDLYNKELYHKDGELTNNERELNNAYRYGENVNHPEHYNRGELEAIDVIEDWELNFNMGSVLKYISRYRYKQNKVEDLKKAIWYINREIECLEKSKY